MEGKALSPFPFPHFIILDMSQPLIARCICRQRSFAEILPLARERDWDLDAIMRETGCGDQCGLCRPYLRRMLTTGETEFHEVIWE